MSQSPVYLPFDAQVARVHDVAPHLRRITLVGDDLRRCHERCLDRRVKILLPRHPGDALRDLPRGEDWYADWLALPTDERPVMRTYTLGAVRPEVGEIDLDFVLHDEPGPAGAFAAGARPGDRLVVVGPVAGCVAAADAGIGWLPGRARQVLLVGDETAVPAIANIVGSLPRDTTGAVLVEVPADTDVPELDAPPGLAVTVLARGEQPHGAQLVAAVRASCWSPFDAGERPAVRHHSPVDPTKTPSADPEPGEDSALWDTPTEPVTADHYAWLAGESTVITTLRRHLVRERGWPRDRVAFMGYWRAGRAEC